MVGEIIGRWVVYNRGQTCSRVAFWFETNIRPTIRNLIHRMRAIGVLGLALLVRFGIFPFPPSIFFLSLLFEGEGFVVFDFLGLF